VIACRGETSGDLAHELRRHRPWQRNNTGARSRCREHAPSRQRRTLDFVPDLAKQKLRSVFEAIVLDAGAKATHKTHGRFKADVIGPMRGTIVELGPGTGVNMRYYSPGVHVIAIEPNPAMHDRLRTKAADHNVEVEIRTLRGEEVDVADASADGVVGTLVLCGVDDPSKVVSEAYRVLKPGGTYLFLEHVAAPSGTITRRVQQALLRPHRWLFNGCEVNRDTESVLRAGRFTDISVEAIDIGVKGGHVRHFVRGTATK
jgi:SAM-dependent methyltransferase